MVSQNSHSATCAIMPVVRFSACLFAGLAVLALSGNAAAAPNAVASIAPVHALVAAVMRGAGEPHLLIGAGDSPHNYVLRPSDAATLRNADVIFWIGGTLESAMPRLIGTLGSQARVVQISGLPGLTRRTADHHDDHGEEEENESDDPTLDPHLWLDPDNARKIVSAAAGALAAIDPGNAALYRRNAEDTNRDIQTLADEIRRTLAPVRHRPFVVLHDAYGYFTDYFGMDDPDVITLSPEVQPGARRIKNLRDAIAENPPDCLFIEPQFPSRLAESLAADAGIPVASLDPLGVAFSPGPGLYSGLMRSIADSIRNCARRGE